MLEIIVVPMIVGYILDLILADPSWLPHPVVMIGRLISFLERKLYRKNCEEKQYRNGVVLAILVVLFSMLIPFVILLICVAIDNFIMREYQFNPHIYTIFSSIAFYQIMATRSLEKAGKKVYSALNSGVTKVHYNESKQENSLDEGRKAVAMIVGRDTATLDEEGVIKATVETIAENTTDGVVAPMIYMALGGVVLSFGYKAINTLDSMVGYRNEKYLYFGRFSAKLDDFANYLPSRITAIFMVISSFVLQYDYKNAWKIFKRDRYKHKSPNSGQTESVCAGALNIQLAGDAFYFGELYKKDFIGDSDEKIDKSHILKACALMITTSLIALISTISILLILNLI